MRSAGKGESMLKFLRNKKRVSSRRQIQIKEVRDNILILPNKTYCMLLETSSINFELKSEEEQDVLIDSFQNFLNALPCKLQVLIRIRELDIEAYLESLSQNAEQEKKSVYKNQLKNYQEFMKKLISGNKILSRRFYIVIPYKQADISDYSLIREQLLLNLDIVIKGLERMGMKARMLDSLEILNLFYTFYSTSSSKIQPINREMIEKIALYGSII